MTENVLYRRREKKKALQRLKKTMKKLSTPEAAAEIIAYLEEVTAEANREHDLVLKRSAELGALRIFP